MNKEDIREPVTEEITRPATTDAIPELVEFASRHVWEAGYSDEFITNIRLGVEEALHNITQYACCDPAGTIQITCVTHDSGALIMNIADTGIPFNMLLAGTFPEVQDFMKPGQEPSTKKLKKAVKNIEYRRAADKNILILTISPTPTSKR